MTLLSRDKFRERVFARDGYKCVICGRPAQDAHHILERRLWPDSGYYLDNGASLCGACHIAAESTVLSCEQIREAAGIGRTVLPPQLYDDERYDKWGNNICSSSYFERLKGELAEDESVKKILSKDVLFRSHVKYPRTYHLPWSPGLQRDDRVMSDLSVLEGSQVVVTVKMDGENTSMYRDAIHARSLSPLASHPSRDRVKSLWGSIAHEIPEGWRLCGENVYGKHSIAYRNLEAYFYGFSVWNEQNVCLGWDETVEWFTLLGVPVVPVLYRGDFDESLIRDQWTSEHSGDPCEGHVVRTAGAYRYRDHRVACGKYVRANHVQTHAHWMQRFEPNGLKDGS